MDMHHVGRRRLIAAAGAGAVAAIGFPAIASRAACRR
jgi:hypothetical protein